MIFAVHFLAKNARRPAGVSTSKHRGKRHAALLCAYLSSALSQNPLRENPHETVKKTLTHTSGITRWRRFFFDPNLHPITCFIAISLHS
ncbi:hypothetical protein [Caballeronia sordidicola]|uniref:hypothetical protein n=1 Tax=Caballeronia sordidicola TaxID=196367 RepID=UPI00126A390E|nr:hypothetical protein [Caballeronia sordidicola]